MQQDLPQMILRLRSQLGVWRVECENGWTVRELKEHLAQQKHVNLDTIAHTPLSRDGKGQQVFPDDATVGSLGLSHGDMVFLLFDEESRNTMGTIVVAFFAVISFAFVAKHELTSAPGGICCLQCTRRAKRSA